MGHQVYKKAQFFADGGRSGRADSRYLRIGLGDLGLPNAQFGQAVGQYVDCIGAGDH